MPDPKRVNCWCYLVWTIGLWIYKEWCYKKDTHFFSLLWKNRCIWASTEPRHAIMDTTFHPRMSVPEERFCFMFAVSDNAFCGAISFITILNPFECRICTLFGCLICALSSLKMMHYNFRGNKNGACRREVLFYLLLRIQAVMEFSRWPFLPCNSLSDHLPSPWWRCRLPVGMRWAAHRLNCQTVCHHRKVCRCSAQLLKTTGTLKHYITV